MANISQENIVGLGMILFLLIKSRRSDLVFYGCLIQAIFTLIHVQLDLSVVYFRQYILLRFY
ncbi:MAG: hypothetical protein EBR87_09180 [Cytophagia bacterium]|nr:hypothetical protein [Cytophagia bacterium]